MSHTPENWAKEPCEGSRHGGFYLVDSDGSGIGHIYAKFGAGEYNARRIVACINACAGIDTDTLEGEFKHLGTEYVEFVGLLEFSDKSLSSAKIERDTYRELCGELVKALSNHIDQTRPIWESVDIIVKAETILGGNNGTSN